MVEVFIISGFLGAGKTTFIQKALQQNFSGKKVALVENDFGEVGVDAALLKTAGFHVTEIRAGCICCTLAGDFVKSLQDVIRQVAPDILVIEPSGVGKLSDIEDACKHPDFAEVLKVSKKITVVDALRCQSYLENFGEFFENQVKHADCILLTRSEKAVENHSAVLHLLKELNPHAQVITEPLEQLDTRCVFEGKPHSHAEEVHTHTCGCGCHGHHHDHTHGCEGHHHADEVFDTVSISFAHSLKQSQLEEAFKRIEQKPAQFGTLLRAKGIVMVNGRSSALQYLPKELRIEPTEAVGNSLALIGKDLAREELHALFL